MQYTMLNIYKEIYDRMENLTYISKFSMTNFEMMGVLHQILDWDHNFQFTNLRSWSVEIILYIPMPILKNEFNVKRNNSTLWHWVYLTVNAYYHIWVFRVVSRKAKFFLCIRSYFPSTALTNSYTDIEFQGSLVTKSFCELK